MFICACSSLEHQMFFWYDSEGDILYVESHLSSRNFRRRLWYGIRYIFGRKCNFGAWDEFLLNEESRNKLQTFLNNLHHEQEKK